MEKLTKEELLARAKKPQEDAMKLHAQYMGKISVTSKCPIRSFDDFAIVYTPGVAEPCRAIKEKGERVFELTNKGNMVAVVSDGTRVLGLGDIGPEAALPVMEGKSLLFKYLGGVDAFPICLGTKDAEEIIKAVKWLEPTFGGINLEDIEQPKCFSILDRLREIMDIPVWHDDQQGTATITLAGLINALKIVGKKISEIRLVMNGAGAAGIAILRILFKAGLDPENTIVVDSKGILHKEREDIKKRKEEFSDKFRLCEITNREGRKGGLEEALRGADVCVSASKPGPDVIKPEWLKKMNKDAILFAMANPIPEIWPWDAKEAGVRIVATGRSDFPNQINNSLGFPAIFRGALDVHARTITDGMCIAAAEELARFAEEKGINEEYLVPKMDEWEVFVREAVAVGMKAQEEGVARLKVSREELEKKAEGMIRRGREEIEVLMKHVMEKPSWGGK